MKTKQSPEFQLYFYTFLSDWWYSALQNCLVVIFGLFLVTHLIAFPLSITIIFHAFKALHLSSLSQNLITIHPNRTKTRVHDLKVQLRDQLFYVIHICCYISKLFFSRCVNANQLRVMCVMKEIRDWIGRRVNKLFNLKIALNFTTSKFVREFHFTLGLKKSFRFLFMQQGKSEAKQSKHSCLKNSNNCGLRA